VLASSTSQTSCGRRRFQPALAMDPLDSIFVLSWSLCLFPARCRKYMALAWGDAKAFFAGIQASISWIEFFRPRRRVHLHVAADVLAARSRSGKECSRPRRFRPLFSRSSGGMFRAPVWRRYLFGLSRHGPFAFERRESVFIQCVTHLVRASRSATLCSLDPVK